eukprot:scaffold83113_cov32-Tisochrysis_lutea.AAC.3
MSLSLRSIARSLPSSVLSYSTRHVTTSILCTAPHWLERAAGLPLPSLSVHCTSAGGSVAPCENSNRRRVTASPASCREIGNSARHIGEESTSS